MILLIYAQAKGLKKYKQYIIKQKRLEDRRGKQVTETLEGIKMCKFNAMEYLMEKKFNRIRLKEKNNNFWKYFTNNFITSLNIIAPLIMAMTSFFSYNLIYGKLTTAQVYSLLTLFYTSTIPLQATVYVASRLLQNFVISDRLRKLALIEPHKEFKDTQSLMIGEVRVENGNFSWENKKVEQIYKFGKKVEIEPEKPKELTLRDVNLKIRPGEFIAVIGKVGSGKSSLLLSLMNETMKVSGNLEKNGKLAYIPQEAFLMNQSIKENITFGSTYSKRKLRSTIEICELKHDMELLPAREYTQIGERGVNMSGGQKQRISIARAVYSENDIYFIDDALSALDAEVGQKIMKNVFFKKLENKTRIMVTHKLSLLEGVDRVLIMKKGKIVFNGSLKKAKRTPEYENLVEEISQSENNQLDDFESEIEHLFMKSSRREGEDYSFDLAHKKKNERKDEHYFPLDLTKKREKFKQKIHLQSDLTKRGERDSSRIVRILQTQRSLTIETPRMFEKNLNFAQSENFSENMSLLEEQGKITQQDQKTDKSSLGRTYYFYFKSLGFVNLFIVFLLYLITSGIKFFFDLWAGFWAEDKLHYKNNKKYEINYLIIFFVFVVFLLLRNVTYSSVYSLMNYKIFKKLLSNFIMRPLSYFDVTPSGEILNRLTVDTNLIDDKLSINGSTFSLVFSDLCVILVATFAVSPFMIAVFFFMIFFFSGLVKKYVKIAVEFKRMKQAVISPVLTNASEMIKGSASLRAYKKTDFLMINFEKRIDVLTRTNRHSNDILNYIKVLGDYGVLFVVSSSIFLLTSGKQFKVNFFNNASTSGLILSNLLSMTSTFQNLTIMVVSIHSLMTSVERIKEYTENKEKEKEFVKKEDKLINKKWPRKGEVELKNVKVRYRPNLPLILNISSLKIKAGQKVGIVGRTGSGKSTLFLTLTRIIELVDEYPEENWIKIDGIEIAKLGLHKARRAITIIPQDPFLLEGTLRSNVDPFGEYDNELILDVLNRVEFILTLTEGQTQNISQTPPVSESVNFHHFRRNLTQRLNDNQMSDQADNILNFRVEHKGSNLSLGQRQLIYIARSLIKKPKILLMDEATASIDEKADEIIQNVIKNQLKGSTVITIAHRLNTIIQYDKVVVLENGRVAEEGSPLMLLEKRGIFDSMVREAGEEFREKMFQMIKD